MLNVNFDRLIKNKLIITFFVSLFLVNTLELAGFLVLNAGSELSLVALKLYYIFLGYVTGSFLLISASMSILPERVFRILTTFVMSSYIILVYFVFCTPYLIIDTIKMGYTITRVPGECYHLITVFGFSTLIGAVFFLIKGTKNKNTLEASRCNFMLIATTPFFLTIIVTTLVMLLSEKINLAGFVSLATTFMLLALIFIESKYHLFRVNSRLPWTKEYKINRKLTKIVNIHSLTYNNRVNLVEIVTEMEKAYMDLALYHSKGVQADASKLLTLTQSTFSRKKLKYFKAEES